MAEFLKLKKSNCKNCHKCIAHCPVKSIRFSGNQAHIINDECILCGQCFVVCPQNAKQVQDETELVSVLLDNDAPVVASLAPSFITYFEGVCYRTMKEALLKLGFADVEETALGATMVKRQYEKMVAEKSQDIIITSCCHTVNLLVEKYYPHLASFLAPVVTPMQAHCDDIKRRMPNAKTVFIGPCLSKKDEAYKVGIDACMTFDELASMLKEAEIEIEQAQDENPQSRARLFPTCGGILDTMTERNPEYTYLAIDGLDNCKAALEDISQGNMHRCFIEMSSCVGSCIGGPIMEKFQNSPIRHYKAIQEFAGKEDFDIPQPEADLLHASYECIEMDRKEPTEEEINKILREMGKYKPSDELNCGTCGYDSCRKKAAAVFQGKAEITMCLPYLMDKSERFSNNILDNTPNGIMAVNEKLEVQMINPSAMKIFNIKSRSDVLGGPLVRIMDPIDFINVRSNGETVKDRRDYYAEFDKFLEMTIVHDKTQGNLIALFRDVTNEEKEKEKKNIFNQQTVETADKVVDKQMQIVQEIASLLGETAAETKIALTKLKEAIPHEDID